MTSANEPNKIRMSSQRFFALARQFACERTRSATILEFGRQSDDVGCKNWGLSELEIMRVSTESKGQLSCHFLHLFHNLFHPLFGDMLHRTGQAHGG